MTTQLPLLPDTEPLSLSEPQRYVQRAREVAAQVCQEKGSASSDNVRDALGPPPTNGHAGAVFTRELFFKVGSLRTRYASGRGRRIGRYALTAAGRRELLGEA